MRIELHFQLFDWQRRAVESWMDGDARGRYRGTLEIFTGGGKTLIAIACWAEARRVEPAARLAVVVPTEALAHQWRRAVAEHTNVPFDQIGLLGAGGSDDFSRHTVLVAVINTASRRLPQLALEEQPLMLVVDECHRAGAPSFRRVLDTPADFRLGLSATPDREELDEDGEPIEYDEHVLGQKLGEVVTRFSLGDARQAGWLPDYTIHHHEVHLLPKERLEYTGLSRRIDELGERLVELGGDTTRARAQVGRRDDLGRLSREYVGLTARRKDLLYRASERHRVAIRLVEAARDQRERPLILLFHERVAEAEKLFADLRKEFGDGVGLEHSKLSDGRRAETLARFRAGRVAVLVSVKSLIEGIDVPAADVGVSVASTSSVRQRVQSLGRVLRRPTEPASRKHAEMHLIYVGDTVDELIYAKEDWADLTGEAANRYWAWPLEPNAAPEARLEPPRTPRPTEEQEWERLGRTAPARPMEWLGTLPDREYSIDTAGTVTTRTGAVVSNAQGVGVMLQALRGRAGGRFFVTPAHRLVIAWGHEDGGDATPMVVGQLKDSFALLDTTARDQYDGIDAASLRAGEPYEGPLDADRGTFAIRQRAGGMIERRLRGRDVEFAFVEGTGQDQQENNARSALDGWRSLRRPGMPFRVNSEGHAWFLDAGQPRFLAAVPGGFVFPSDIEQQEELPGLG
jgi:superfamily II DNA or RNA helicase